MYYEIVPMDRSHIPQTARHFGRLAKRVLTGLT
jgi:hypothetical protein